MAFFAAPAAWGQSASDSPAAQALFEQARTLMAKGRAAEACPKLEESQRLDPAIGTMLNLARCYEQAGRLASAWNGYLEAAAAAKSAHNAPREAEARQRAEALRPKLSNLVIVVSPEARAIPGLQVKRDGQDVGSPQWGLPIPSDAGEHTLNASATGYADWQSVIVVKGDASTVSITVPALTAIPVTAPPPAPPPVLAAPPGSTSMSEPRRGLGTQKVLALVTGGVSVLSLGVGVFFGVKSKSEHDDAAKYCRGSLCTDTRGVEAGNDAYAAGNVATAFTVIGAAGIAAGAVLWLTAPSSSAASVQVGLAAGSARLRGVW
jgi:tetratricopeptide (TPR) repeat protein